MRLLSDKELDDGSKSFGLLVSFLVPLFITYRWSGDLALALPTAGLMWGGLRALERRVDRFFKERHEARIREAMRLRRPLGGGGRHSSAEEGLTPGGPVQS